MLLANRGKVPLRSYMLFVCEHCGKKCWGTSNYKPWHCNDCEELQDG